MNELFYNINPREKEKILKFLEANTLHFKKNTTVISSLKNENIIGLVLNGYLQRIKTDYNGNVSILEEFYEDDVFGNNRITYSFSEQTVIAKEDSKVVIIYFDDIINSDLSYAYFIQFLKNLLKIYSKKLNNNNDRIEILTNKTIRNKLLTYFKIKSKQVNSKIIYLPYNYSDLADYLAVDRSSMHRELKNLKEEGIIDVKNKKITLNIFDE